MEMLSTCRCCLTEGLHKDLYEPYAWLGKQEIYSEMLQECFNIVLSSAKLSRNAICEECIKTLRSSLSFKQQVLRVEEEMLCKLNSGETGKYFNGKPLDVKLEPKDDSDGDSDDYFLADAVREAPLKIIKSEKKNGASKKRTDTKKSVSKTRDSINKNSDNGWRVVKIKNLVTRLQTSIDSCDMPTLKSKKPESANKRITSLETSKINIRWSTRPPDKIKHRDNLHTILQFSNAMPFKNKSLLGYICGYCDCTYPDPADLRLHAEGQHKKQRLDYKCSFDMTEYTVKLDVMGLICTLCNAKMDNLNVLKEHLVKMHSKTIHTDIKDHILQFKLTKGDVYDCALCSSTYETFKMLKQHMNIHYSNYTCSKCDAPFATKRSLHAHRTTHLEGNFKCDHCDKVFPSRSKKMYHEKMKHLGARNISNCPYCDEPFRSYYQRNQHLIKVHNLEAQYKCNVCGRAFVLKSLLMSHIKKNHLMERNCQCTECGYRFFSKKALKAHMVKHSGERQFVCEVCNKAYARKYTLREHMRIHNNDRRFKCSVCGLTFVQKCSLKSHLLSNHGISMAASDIVTCT
ncbi:hypothetical protein K1T71_014597 [Dendrolimus kikuchii]|uniref:Uncharacterized protein n=1 Tax=Dendrolimus kikuchii TaxID=765133 RepID=A0ACC1CEL2_9NEOP|nr:hypothetical protein K1T71_014597 [Dendrolimus kikuchii]